MNYPELRIIHYAEPQVMPSRRAAARVLPAQRAGDDERLGITQRSRKTSSWSRARSRPGWCWAGTVRRAQVLEGEVGVNVDLRWSRRCCICLWLSHKSRALEKSPTTDG